ncbi:MAG TPA: type I restriction enzyme HsdR N-terminal domain-containing protein [Bacteroidales bacterium]|nr:type I restriction enzyme HsdR N-terminal domain-containing protein [Bacteroidales bacterium]HRW96295.1 type I restriction enzyme HsdR N-terminal domain-containing protein [Bacteroidales bacterium]
MEQLNLPFYQFTTRNAKGKEEIFDVIRRKFVALTPEEWVRQHFIHYLNTEKNVPLWMIAVEKTLIYNRMNKRADILVYSGNGKPLLMAECKAASVPINQRVFDQVARYNLTMRVPFLVVTNGLVQICCKINLDEASYEFLGDIPDYETLVRSENL